MQDRLAQQQKAMAEERAYLKEIISKMDTQLSEQQRQLEKVGVKSGLKNRYFKQKLILFLRLRTAICYVHLRNAGR